MQADWWLRILRKHRRLVSCRVAEASKLAAELRASMGSGPPAAAPTEFKSTPEGSDPADAIPGRGAAAAQGPGAASQEPEESDGDRLEAPKEEQLAGLPGEQPGGAPDTAADETLRQSPSPPVEIEMEASSGGLSADDAAEGGQQSAKGVPQAAAEAQSREELPAEGSERAPGNFPTAPVARTGGEEESCARLRGMGFGKQESGPGRPGDGAASLAADPGLMGQSGATALAKPLQPESHRPADERGAVPAGIAEGAKAGQYTSTDAGRHSPQDDVEPAESHAGVTPTARRMKPRAQTRSVDQHPAQPWASRSGVPSPIYPADAAFPGFDPRGPSGSMPGALGSESGSPVPFLPVYFSGLWGPAKTPKSDPKGGRKAPAQQHQHVPQQQQPLFTFGGAQMGAPHLSFGAPHLGLLQTGSQCEILRLFRNYSRFT